MNWKAELAESRLRSRDESRQCCRPRRDRKLSRQGSPEGDRVHRANRHVVGHQQQRGQPRADDHRHNQHPALVQSIQQHAGHRARHHRRRSQADHQQRRGERRSRLLQHPDQQHELDRRVDDQLDAGRRPERQKGPVGETADQPPAQARSPTCSGTRSARSPESASASALTTFRSRDLRHWQHLEDPAPRRAPRPQSRHI